MARSALRLVPPEPDVLVEPRDYCPGNPTGHLLHEGQCIACDRGRQVVHVPLRRVVLVLVGLVLLAVAAVWGLSRVLEALR